MAETSPANPAAGQAVTENVRHDLAATEIASTPAVETQIALAKENATLNAQTATATGTGTATTARPTGIRRVLDTTKAAPKATVTRLKTPRRAPEATEATTPEGAIAETSTTAKPPTKRKAAVLLAAVRRRLPPSRRTARK